MTELERRAMLGDRKAQEEATRWGIVLPCPFCGGHKGGADGAIFKWANTENFCHKRTGKCALDGMIIYNLDDWNTRPAPPIGRCWECVYSTGPDENGMLFCENLSVGMKREDFCSDFNPKERKQ